MKTEMKALLSLLLLACVCTVHGGCGGGNRERGDVCSQGRAAVAVFARARGCRGSQNDPRLMFRELRRSMGYNLTLDTLRHVFTNYCSTLMPRLRECFEGGIENCSADQQRYLMAMAQQTGFICQPDTNAISPQISRILAKLSADDLAENPSCWEDLDRHKIGRVCSNRTLTVMGLPENGFRLLDNLTMEQLAPKVEVYFRTMTECTVTQIRDDPNRCQQWRGLAMRVVTFILTPVLGNMNGMTFTNQDIDRMFEWQSPARRDDTGGLDDFMQLGEEWL